jgi:hypothetical protein
MRAESKNTNAKAKKIKAAPPSKAKSPATPHADVPTLVVRKSQVRVPGSTRVHLSHLEQIGGKSNDMVVITSGKKSVALHAFADDLVPKNTIVLRSPAMQRLGIEEGDKVVMSSYTTGGKAVRQAFHSAGVRMGRRMDLIDEESN